MTDDQFRKLALGFPETIESSHMGHADFRVGGKIFATLGAPEAGWGMVKLTPDDQDLFIQLYPSVFYPAKGAWGRRGYTLVLLNKAKMKIVREALVHAWKKTAPKSIAKLFGDD